MAKMSLSQVQEAELQVAEFKALVEMFVKEKGYLYLNKQAGEVIVAVQEWLYFKRQGV